MASESIEEILSNALVGKRICIYKTQYQIADSLRTEYSFSDSISEGEMLPATILSFSMTNHLSITGLRILVQFDDGSRHQIRFGFKANIQFIKPE